MSADRLIGIDEDALTAAVRVIGSSGATQTDIGYLHDDVPIDKASWWATAVYRGMKLTVENRASPVEAAEALARLVLRNAMCAHCRRTVTLDGESTPSTGPLTTRQQRREMSRRIKESGDFSDSDQRVDGWCRWTRVGAEWKRGCDGVA